MRKKSSFLLRLILALSIIVFLLLYYSINIGVINSISNDEVRAATCYTNLTTESPLTSTCASTTTKCQTTSQAITFPTSAVLTTTAETTATTTMVTTTATTIVTITTTPFVSCTDIAKTVTSISTIPNCAEVNNAIIFNNNCIFPVEICEMNQENVDRFNIILSNEFEKYDSAKTVCGHNTRSLRHLYNTNVDDIITLIINGVPENYYVFLSEEVVLSSDSYDLLSLEDGSSLYVRYYNDSNILRIFTCVNSILPNRRWLVLGQKIS